MVQRAAAQVQRWYKSEVRSRYLDMWTRDGLCRGSSSVTLQLWLWRVERQQRQSGGRNETCLLQWSQVRLKCSFQWSQANLPHRDFSRRGEFGLVLARLIRAVSGVGLHGHKTQLKLQRSKWMEFSRILLPALCKERSKRCWMGVDQKIKIKKI